MKKIMFGILAVTAVVGCGKTADVVDENHQEETHGVEIVADVVATKTTHTDGGAVETAWKKDDAVGIFWYKGSSAAEAGTGAADRLENGKILAKESGSSTSFDAPEHYLAEKGTDYLTYAYYPYSSEAGTDPLAVKFTLPAAQTQAAAGNLDHLSETDFLYASTTAKNNGTDKVDLSFKHALSVLAINLTTEEANLEVSALRVSLDGEGEKLSVTEGSVNLATGELALTAGSPEISLTVTSSALLSSKASTFYMMITPGHAGRTVSVYATIGGKEELVGSKTIPAYGTGIPAGAKAEMEFKISHSAVFADFEDGSLSAFTAGKFTSGGSELSVVENPQNDALNVSKKVLKAVVNSTSTGASGYFTILREAIVAQGIDPSEYKGIRVQYLWKGTVQLVPRIDVGSARQLPDNSADISLNGEWQTLEYEINFPTPEGDKKGNRTFRPFMTLDGKSYSPASMKEENRVCEMYFDNFTLYK